MITSKTKLYGVIGDPIEHSLSPILQNLLLERLQEDARYVAFHVSADNLADAIRGMRALGICGLNVTVPYKEKVLTHLDKISPQANLLGSVNTITNVNGTLHGYNTDVPGFTNSVANLRYKFNKGRVILIGAGGAARAVVFALKELNVSDLFLCDLSLEVTEPLVEKCRNEFEMENVQGVAIDDASLFDVIHSCSVLINATPVGMSPNVSKSPLPDNFALHRKMLVYDLIYNPAKTRLLLDAEKSGALIQNGLDMLIFQGVASMEIWTGQKIDVDEQLLHEIRITLNSAMVTHG